MGADRLAELELEARREAALQTVTAEPSTATRAQILSVILDEGTHVLAPSAAGAYLLSDDGASLSLVARRGIADDIARTLDSLPLASNYPVARSVREGLPVWVSSHRSLARDFPELERAMSFERQAVVALPLRVNGHLVGGLGFAFPEEHPFDKGERALMTTLAARCESAMERARLHEDSRQARAAAEQSRAEAEALLRFNEVVAGILAHDLKNPLAAILMNARLLRDADLERARTVGARIVTSGERMSRMIDQILEWTRLRAGAGWVHLTRAACDLGALTNEVVVELRGRRTDASVIVEASGDLRGSWDADRLAQVISTLVGNALDHASSPGVRVTLDGTGAQVRLAVKNGGTIEDDFLPLVFEPFRGRVAGVKSRGRGLGLGLYITRQIVLAHGGTIDVEGSPDATVTFVVTLPRGP